MITRQRTIVALLLATGVLAACSSLSGISIFPDTPTSRVRGHVTTLASDNFEGRGTGTIGYERAATYVSNHFAEQGLKAPVEAYRQDVPLRAIEVDSIEGELTLTADGKALDLELEEDHGFYPPSDVPEAVTEAQAAGDIVYVGHGIQAPTLGFNAYTDVDVRGKFVMMFRGAPDIEDRAYEVHLQRFDTKRAEAKRRGAVGIIYLDADDRSVKRLTRLRAGHPKGSLSIGAGFDDPMPTAVVNLDTARALFEASGLDFDQALEELKEGEAQSTALKASAELMTKARSVAVETFNVVGLIPGNNPELDGEAVVVTAHLDHLGMRRRLDVKSDDKKKADAIFNGALDNAMGTAIVMEAAQRLAEVGGAERTVIFAAVTAEESGLLGSAHLARTVEDLGYDAVANINVDMPVLVYPFNDVIGFGAEYSSLKGPLDAAAEEVGVVATPDPLPELSLFVRSDHYRFVQEGIPALFLFNGMSGEGKENFQTFMATHYHKPSDQTDLPIRWDDAARFTDLSYGLIKRIADDPVRPTWNEDVAFAPEEPRG